MGFAIRLLAGEPATAVVSVKAGVVTGITVTSGGSGYLKAPAVMLSGGGGSGAAAAAVLAGDQVASVVVLAGGTGYTSPPTVGIEAPPKPLRVRLEPGPRILVDGPEGSLARVESSATVVGPWEAWTNVVVGGGGAALVDVRPAWVARFYRAASAVPSGFVWISPGTFVMGSPISEAGRETDEVAHPVAITQGFWMSDHETTQAEYQSVVGNNPSTFRGEDNPVEMVTWNAAVEYCRKLTQRERASGRITAQQEYRLPTEAEWEYAARAGTTGPRHGPLAAVAWSWGNPGDKTHPVRQKAANAWGLHDMMGNVWEWCSDWYGGYPTDRVQDPVGSSTGSYRVLRGGGWGSYAIYCRSASRSGADPGFRSDNLGFRVVLAPVR